MSHKTKAKRHDGAPASRYSTDMELINRYAERLGVPFEDSRFLIHEFVDVLNDLVVNTGAINIRKFGLLYLTSRRRIKFTHPKTGEQYQIPMKYYLKFSPSGHLRSLTNSKIKENLRTAYKIQEEE